MEQQRDFTGWTEAAVTSCARAIDPEYVWVESTSHRGRDYLARIAGKTDTYVWREFMTKTGYFHRVPRRYLEQVERVKGLKIRSRLHVDQLMPCLYS